jgi:hypothetical protein
MYSFNEPKGILNIDLQNELLTKRNDNDLKIFENNIEGFEKKVKTSMIDVQPTPEKYFFNLANKDLENEKNDEVNKVDMSEENDSEDEEEDEFLLQVKENDDKKLKFFKKFWSFINKYLRSKKQNNLKNTFEKMEKKLKSFIKYFFKKMFNKKTINSKTLSEIFNHEIFIKRNEEKLKKIYKMFLKKEFKNFIQIKLKNKSGKVKRNEKSQKLYQFYKNIFKDIIQEKVIHEDLIMDVLSESTDVKKKSFDPLTRNNNWTHRGFHFPKKISTYFRYLVKKSGNFNERFNNYLSTSAMNESKKIIKSKMDKKKIEWEEILKTSIDIPDFIKQFKAKMDNDKTKLKFAWSIRSLEISIDYCLVDLEKNLILKYDFDKLMSNHYSAHE